MRALLSHSLQLVVSAALLVGLGLGFTGLPLPIGHLSDYGAVLDRHGREEIAHSIEKAKELYGLEVYVLASWENPLPNIDSFAQAVFTDWGLAQHASLLAVFLKDGRNWDVRVLGAPGVHASYGDLAGHLQAGIADLVEHRRVREAMTELFEQLEQRLGAPAAPPADGQQPVTGLPPVAVVGLLFAGVLVLALLISRHVCPQCGRLLRAETRSAFEGTASPHRVYSCRRCGYRKRLR